MLKQVDLMLGTIAIVTHDAGGAELLANFIKRNRLKDVALAIEGPALSVFRRVLGEIQIDTLESVLDRSDWVLTGSSWQSELEWHALQLSRTLGKRSVTFLDHWLNYRARFVRMDTECLPDALWVADRYALQIAEREFPGAIIENKGNPYLESIAERATRHLNVIEPGQAQRVLIVTEPVSVHALKQHGDALYFGYTEFDAVELILARLPHLLGGKALGQIIVRPHPSEPLHKYEYLVDNSQGLPVIVRKDGDLLDEVLDSSIVIGCETMALVVALAAGRRAVSCIPATGRACSLPHEKIERWH
ncbi:hypothetical protein [Pollutimonas sp. M17]|uniref:hypothetical protein n=1 Tax=Pollutimonas sp. M17 TaxID=2962065 RepID=UPI0021F4E316|nr:hypothetical protein [Pollutimonas sp. M17]UYO93971.1 hypothetical protein OEG81_01165 [Pollutimonas sp. M17]